MLIDRKSEIFYFNDWYKHNKSQKLYGSAYFKSLPGNKNSLIIFESGNKN